MPIPQDHLDFIAAYPPLAAIGNTPTVRLDLPLDLGAAEIFAKCEQLNPGGSIKDRPVLRMLVDAILTGRLTRDQVILDATSGNAGIAYAMIGAVLGYSVELVMPENASEERKKRLLAHGATLTFTDPMLGYDETLYEVKRRYEADPGRYFYCDQYSNANNPQAHYETTAEEILRQVDGITHFVAGVGTGGTISGVGRRLKEHDPNIEVVGINFDEWPGVEGLKPLGQGPHRARHLRRGHRRPHGPHRGGRRLQDVGPAGVQGHIRRPVLGRVHAGSLPGGQRRPERPRRYHHQRHRRALLQHEPVGLDLEGRGTSNDEQS